MIKNISLLLFLLSVSLFSKHAHAQHARPDPEPFSYSSSAATQKEAKEITGLRASYRQFMLAVSASKSYNFNQIRSASAITVGSTEEESLQYLIEASRIIRQELLEKLPGEFLLAELKNYNPPVSPSKQGMILGLRKDLDLYRAQMANSR